MFVQRGARVKIKVGDLYDDARGRRVYKVDAIMHGVVEGSTLYYEHNYSAQGGLLGRLEVRGGEMVGVNYSGCYVNRHFKRSRIR